MVRVVLLRVMVWLVMKVLLVEIVIMIDFKLFEGFED